MRRECILITTSIVMMSCSSPTTFEQACARGAAVTVPLSALQEVSPREPSAHACAWRRSCAWRIDAGDAVHVVGQSVAPPGHAFVRSRPETSARIREGLVTAWNDGEWGNGLSLAQYDGAAQSLVESLVSADSAVVDGRKVRDRPVAVVQHGEDRMWVVASRTVGEARAPDPWIGGRPLLPVDPDTVVWDATVENGSFVGGVVARLAGLAVAAATDGDGVLVVRTVALDRVDSSGAVEHLHRFEDPAVMTSARAPVRLRGDIFIPTSFGLVKVVGTAPASIETWLLPEGCRARLQPGAHRRRRLRWILRLSALDRAGRVPAGGSLRDRTRPPRPFTCNPGLAVAADGRVFLNDQDNVYAITEDNVEVALTAADLPSFVGQGSPWFADLDVGTDGRIYVAFGETILRLTGAHQAELWRDMRGQGLERELEIGVVDDDQIALVARTGLHRVTADGVTLVYDPAAMDATAGCDLEDLTTSRSGVFLYTPGCDQFPILRGSVDGSGVSILYQSEEHGGNPVDAFQFSCSTRDPAGGFYMVATGGVLAPRLFHVAEDSAQNPGIREVTVAPSLAQAAQAQNGVPSFVSCSLAAAPGGSLYMQTFDQLWRLTPQASSAP